MPRLNRRTLVGVAAVVALLVLSSAGAGAASLPPSPPSNLLPTPAFTNTWSRAKAAFNTCYWTLAYKRYNVIEHRGTRLADVVLRYNFYGGIASAAYAAGDRAAARTYALAAQAEWNTQMTVAQQASVHLATRAIEDITVDQYYFAPMSVTACHKHGMS
jgi:hypothetical protein